VYLGVSHVSHPREGAAPQSCSVLRGSLLLTVPWNHYHPCCQTMERPRRSSTTIPGLDWWLLRMTEWIGVCSVVWQPISGYWRTYVIIRSDNKYQTLLFTFYIHQTTCIIHSPIFSWRQDCPIAPPATRVASVDTPLPASYATDPRSIQLPITIPWYHRSNPSVSQFSGVPSICAYTLWRWTNKFDVVMGNNFLWVNTTSSQGAEPQRSHFWRFSSI